MGTEETRTIETKPTFKEYFKSFFRKIGNLFIRWPVALPIAIIVIVGAFLCFVVFRKTFQIGGILQALFGHKTNTDPNIKTTVVPNRVDDKGNPIIPGQSDDKGYVQPVVVPIKEPGIFDDPNSITIDHPNKGETKIPLPTGVKNSDVSQIIIAQPNSKEVGNNDKGVNTNELLIILK